MLTVATRANPAADAWGQITARVTALRCSACGYEISSYRTLPDCPMCHASHWQSVRWRTLASQGL